MPHVAGSGHLRYPVTMARHRRRELFPADRGLQVRMVLASVLTPVVVIAAVVLVALVLPHKIAWIVLAAVVIGTALACRGWWRSRGADEEPDPDIPELDAAVDRLCALADLPRPRLVRVRERQPNSWVTATPGRRPRLHVTTGLLDLLTAEELEAVVGHELAHIANHDALVMTVVGGPGAILQRGGGGAARLGLWGAIGGGLAIAIGRISEVGTNALSRYRELSADAASAAMTGRPMALASALGKVSGELDRLPSKDLREVAGRDVFHLMPVERMTSWRFDTWFVANHPPLHVRTARLEAMERTLHAARPALRADA
jgi:heat shock protein HtpX